MIIMVTGGRELDDIEPVVTALEPYTTVGSIMVNGGARGLDFLARQYWQSCAQLPYVTVPAAWNRQGKAAGQIRNIVMARGHAVAPYGVIKPDLLVAFPGGRGTAGAVRAAEAEGIEVVYATY